MNVDRRWWATSAVRVRILAAGLALLGVGCAILGWGSRSHRSISKLPATSAVPMMAGQLETAGNALAAPVSTTGDMAQVHSLFNGLPLMFEPNEGQGNLDAADRRARFISRGSGYSLFLGSEGAILSLVSQGPIKPPRAGMTQKPAAARVDSIQMKLAGANPNANLSASDLLPGKSNYFIGNDPKKWRSGLPQFARVHYENVYPGVNLVFYGNQGHLEYDFQVAPGSDPAQAELEFQGAKQLELKNGALVIKSEGGSVQLDAPVVYQEIAGKREPVEGNFVLRGGNRAGFSVGAYDRSRELIIDPILNFSTYFGGSLDEHASSVAVDGSFNIYLVGSTTSPDLPVTSSVVQGALNGTGPNVYIAKMTPPLGSLTAILEDVTYLGGTGSDTPVGVAVDGEGDVFLAGTTSSTNFPVTVTTAYQSSPMANSPGPHVFVTKLKFDFTALQYSSYLSGNGSDTASGMTADSAGNIFVTGTTTSTNAANASAGIQFPASVFPSGVAFQQFSVGAIQFFVTKVNTNASGQTSVAYSTYFGGANFIPPPPVATTGPCGQVGGTNPAPSLPCAVGGQIAVDSTGDVYFTGSTNFTFTGCTGCSSTDFPILDAYQACLDVSPAAQIVNPPSCTNAPSTTPPLPNGPDVPDAFVAKLNPNAGQGLQLQWSTYLGGSGADAGVGIALDAGAANVYVVGTTNSPDFVNLSLATQFASFQKCLDNLPQTPPNGVVTCTPPTAPAATDAFVGRLTNVTNQPGTSAPLNVSLNYFSYLGGANNETGNAIAVDTNSGAVVTGSTQSPYTGAAGSFPLFPAPNSLQSQLNGPEDAFVARINTAAQSTNGTSTQQASWASFFGGSGTDFGTGITLDVNQNTYLVGETDSTDFPVAKPLQSCLDTPVNPASGTPCPTLASPPPTDAFVAQLGTAISLSIQGVLSLSASQTFISAGNPAQFTYTITNNGPDLASNIVVTDNLDPSVTKINFTNVSATISSGTCGGGSTSTSLSCGPISLASGSTATVTISATPTATGSSPVPFNGGTVQAMAPGNIVLAQTSVPAQMSDYSMAVSPGSQTVPVAGDSAIYQVQLTPHPIYASGISLSCSNLPPGAACAFNPQGSTTLQSSSGSTITLGITTTARPITTPAAAIFHTPRFYAVWLTLPGLALLGVGGSRRRRRILGILMFCATFGMLVLLPACSSTTVQPPVSGTPAGSYNVNVTATSGSDSKSQTIVLNVP